jgi:hypothetical protein
MSTNQRSGSSPFGGSEQVTDLLQDRWWIYLEIPMRPRLQGAEIEAYINSMRGLVNNTPVYHFSRPQPRGTARGTQTLSAAVAQGAAVLPITGISPATGSYLLGDMIGVGGLLFMVAADVIAVAGAASVPITNRVRVAQNSGAAVTWDKPTAPFRLMATSGVQYNGDVAQAVTFDFAEKIS